MVTGAELSVRKEVLAISLFLDDKDFDLRGVNG